VSYRLLWYSGDRLWDSRVFLDENTKSALFRIVDDIGGIEFVSVRAVRIGSKMEICPAVSMSFGYMGVFCPYVLVHIDNATGVIDKLLARYDGIEAEIKRRFDTRVADNPGRKLNGGLALFVQIHVRTYLLKPKS
jgi:hypothetical protein